MCTIRCAPAKSGKAPKGITRSKRSFSFWFSIVLYESFDLLCAGDDAHEGIDLQGGSSDQGAVNIGLAEQLGGVPELPVLIYVAPSDGLAPPWQCDPAVLEVRRDNLPAIALYQGFGWRETGVRHAYYADGTDALQLRWSPS